MIFLPTVALLWFHMGNLPPGKKTMKKFPVRNAPEGCAKFVDQSVMSDPHARDMHGLGLERLAREGGLSAYDVACNIRRKPKYAACHDAVDVCNLFAAG